jgi:hypothetical protein
MIAQDAAGSHIFEAVKQLVLQEARELCSALAAAPSGAAAEQMALEWSRNVGRQVLQAGLQARVEQVQGQAQRDCKCAGRRQIHSQRWRTVLTLLGPVRVERAYLRCQSCGAWSFPADEWLGWQHGCSHLLEEAVAWQVAAMPYREALKGLRKLCGVELSLAAAQQIAGRWGAAELKLQPYAQRVKGRMVVEIDGTMAHVDGAWHEIKLATCMPWCRGKPGQTTYVADWLTAEQFAEPLWREVVARGAPTAKAIAVVADGAPWIWDLANTVLSRPVEILDWYHACEHLWQAGRVVQGDGTPETAALVGRWKGELRGGHSEGLEEELRELAGTVGDPDQVLRKTANYLATHQTRLRYPLFRAAGWPIGSGVVEGGCGHVVGLRFKRKSTRWKAPGLRAILHLRLDLLNDRWENRCDYLRSPSHSN